MKKKVLSVALIVSLVALIVTGASLALLTDTDTATNVFISSNSSLDITLDESKVIPDANALYNYIPDEEATDRVLRNEYNNILPGSKLFKDPTVHNNGTLDAWVAVTVTTDSIAHNAMSIDDFNEEAWTYIGESEDAPESKRVEIYMLNTKLQPESSSTLFTGVTIADLDSNGVEALGGNFAMEVNAYAIQDNFEDSNAAYEGLCLEFSELCASAQFPTD